MKKLGRLARLLLVAVLCVSFLAGCMDIEVTVEYNMDGSATMSTQQGFALESIREMAGSMGGEELTDEELLEQIMSSSESDSGDESIPEGAEVISKETLKYTKNGVEYIGQKTVVKLDNIVDQLNSGDESTSYAVERIGDNWIVYAASIMDSTQTEEISGQAEVMGSEDPAMSGLEGVALLRAMGMDMSMKIGGSAIVGSNAPIIENGLHTWDLLEMTAAVEQGATEEEAMLTSFVLLFDANAVELQETGNAEELKGILAHTPGFKISHTLALDSEVEKSLAEFLIDPAMSTLVVEETLEETSEVEETVADETEDELGENSENSSEWGERSDSEEQEETPEPKKSLNWVLIGAIIIAIVLVLLVVILIITKNSNKGNGGTPPTTPTPYDKPRANGNNQSQGSSQATQVSGRSVQSAPVPMNTTYEESDGTNYAEDEESLDSLIGLFDDADDSAEDIDGANDFDELFDEMEDEDDGDEGYDEDNADDFDEIFDELEKENEDYNEYGGEIDNMVDLLDDEEIQFGGQPLKLNNTPKIDDDDELLEF